MADASSYWHALSQLAQNVGSGARDLVATPGAAMAQNPYPPGSEEAAWYDQNRQDTISHWAPAMATSMVGAGTPLAEEGALGMAGGRTIVPGGAPLRAPGGKFLKPMSDGRGMPNPFVPETAGYKVARPGEVAPTAEPVNPMYSAADAPDMAAAAKLLERRGSDAINVNPADVERWRGDLPNSFAETPAVSMARQLARQGLISDKALGDIEARAMMGAQ